MTRSWTNCDWGDLKGELMKFPLIGLVEVRALNKNE